ncbi:LysR family transcriptional regulator [Lysinibacillus sp. BW-2-10]|uniref:LysR family transcriptional regulator n=1 Tax=Lysinibacillus sp. BW-2-10 TaxID=2590030 RepID=UPI0011810B9A|nr:LysR family transcriptional regulator [Lysinibacillus sp. BW-2-10]TSI04545.1 LysR family transcriptional regulator [Lysinibacillus sp. BW-2-10]
MDLRQLKYFVTIVEEGQITKAAKRLHMAQPPLSYQLKLIESELGCKLFDRNGRNLSLTESGRILYEKSKSLLSTFEETMSEVKEVGKGVKGLLSIGVDQTCQSYIVEKIISMRRQFPDLCFKINEGDTFTLTERLDKKEIDVAIIQHPIEDERFDFMSLLPEQYVLITPEKWPLESPVAFKSLKDTPFLSFYRHRNCNTFKIINDEFRRHGFLPNIICDCIDLAMIVSLVREGLGVTILPRTSLNKFSINGIKILEFADCNIQSKATIIWKKDRYLSKTVRNFIHLFNESNAIEIDKMFVSL